MNSLEIYRSFLKILILPVKTGKLSLILAKKKKIKLRFGNILVYLHLKKTLTQNIILMLLDQINSAWSSLSNSSDVGMDKSC